MKQIIKKGSFFTLLFMLLGCLSLYAADNDLITKQITIKLEEAGTLPDRIASSRKYKITNLKIIGEINGTDLSMIREMAGRDDRGNSTDGKLSVLDLSEAKIVEGGDCYYKDYYTSNDVIGSYAFYGCHRLTSLTLPAGITSIGSNAFEFCSRLTSLTLPASITSIGRYVFNGCSGLTSLNLPAGITEIGDAAFCDCRGLTSLTLPAGITEIGSWAFSGCSGLTSIYVYAEKLPKMGSNVFEGCDAKKCTVYIPMGTYDDYWLSEFGYFENIVEFEATGIDKTTINLEKAGTLSDRIGSSKKYKITNLKIIGEINGTDWRMIREMAGRDDRGNSTDGKLSVLDLSEAKIVEGGDWYYNNYYYKYYTSNDKIGSRAFEDCSGLTSLTLPAGITEIGSDAFSGCSGLTSLTLPAGITKIGNAVFHNCSGLTSLTLPAGITEIGSSTFRGCSGLTSLNLPAGITEIGSDAFSGCSGLTSLNLPAGITEIRFGTFRGCSGLTSLNLPAGITEIGSDAFSGCSGLTSLNLPAGITSIDWNAFYGCRGLMSLNLPAGITSIGGDAFWGCSGLTSIYVYAEKVPKIDSKAFEGFDAKKCTLYVPMGTYDDYRLSGFGYYFENIVEFDATGIDKTTISTDVEEVTRYSVNGQRLSAPTKGLNIVKYSDGSVKKVTVR